MKTNALTVSGGGSKGAFAVGAVDVLHRELDLEFAIYAGTSTGALMAPLLAHRGADAIDTLRTLYTSVHTRDILKRRDPPERILRAPSINQTEPLLEILEENITDAVASDLLDPNAERHLILTTVDLTSGKLVYHHTGPDLHPSDGVASRLTSRDAIIKATFASATIPVFMPPVAIAGPDGTHPHVDGGVRAYAPISVTIDAGATDLYCILLSPPAHVKPASTSSFTRLEEVLMRTIDMLTEEVGENDVRIAQMRADAAFYLAAVRAKLETAGLTADQIAQAMAPADVFNPFVRVAATTLKIIRPERALEGSTLEFDPDVMRRNMEYGAECARRQIGALIV